MQNTIARHTARTHKGFSLVELVIVIIIIAILAVAVFAGGSITVKKSQVSRTISDLHNFSVAVEATLNENPDVANYSNTDKFDALEDTIVAALNKNLPADYQLSSTFSATKANVAYTAGTNSVVFESVKKDSWDNNYYVIFDMTERSGEANTSEFYITVVSAGPNSITEIAGKTDGKGINKDDIFNLVEYKNGDVAAVTINMADATTVTNGNAVVGNAYAGVAKSGTTVGSPYIF